MNILILNWRDPWHPFSGGAEMVLYQHVKYWQKKGAKITWYTSSYITAKNDETREGIHFVRRGSEYTVHLYFFFSALARSSAKFDIVIDCFHFIPFFSPLFFDRKKIVAVLHEVAGSVWFSNLPYVFAYIGYLAEPRIIAFYKKITFITGSDSAKKDLEKIGLLSEYIHIVHHGFTQIPVSPSIKKEKKPTFIFLARVSMDKGITDALKAFSEVQKSVKDAQFWIVGKEESPGLIQSLLGMSELKNCRKAITYYGFVTEKEKFILLKKAWLLIHPSKKEGWGLNVIEAASQGTPTVGYDVEGLRDSIVDGKTGMLVEPQNYKALAKVAAELIVDKNKTLYNALSKNAIERAKLFKWDVSNKKSWNIISTLYEKNKQGKR